MNNILKLVFFSLLVMAFTSCSKDGLEGPEGPRGERGEIGEVGERGERGEVGEQGSKGDDGNANVRKFRFRIAKDDWSSGHFGGGNIHSTFIIDPSLTGGISISNANYIALAYVRPWEGEYNEAKQVPYVFGVDNDYGIRFELLPTRSYLTMSKTTNGWDSASLPLSQRPDNVQVDIILIEVGLMSNTQGKFDLKNFEAVSTYFNLN